MRLENLYPNFGKSPPEEQQKFMVEYRLRRSTDLAAIPPTSKKSTVKTSKIDISLTDEEKAIMKMLGLKAKDIAALKASVQEEIATDDKDLFKDELFEEEE
jgi:O-glycosyl hydrolase